MTTLKPCSLGLDSVLPGSVLADEVRDAHGGVLLPRGAAVTEANLQSLRRRGVASLTVLVEVAEESVTTAVTTAAASAAQLAQIEARIDLLFRHAGDNPAVRDLKQRILDYRRGLV